MKLTLKKKFLIPTIALIVLGMGVSATLSYVKAKSALKDALEGQTTQLAASTERNLTSWVKDRLLDVQSWSQQKIYISALKVGFVGKGAQKALSKQLNKTIAAYQYYENICLADISGNILAAGNEEAVGSVNVSDLDFFKAALDGKVKISKVMPSKESGNPIFAVSTPVQVEGAVKGILFSSIDMAAFSHIFIDPIKVGESGYAYIYGQDGLVIAHPDSKHILKLNMKELDFGKRMIEMGSGLITYTWNGMEKTVAFRKSDRLGWTVGVGGSTRELFSAVDALRNINLIVALIVVISVAIILLFITNSVVKPINQAVHGLRDAAEGEGDLTKRLIVKSEDEVGALATWFNVFIEKVQHIIRDLAENSGSLNHSSKGLSDIAGKMSSGAELTSAKAETVSNSSGEMSDNMNGAASTMDQASSNLNMIASSSEEMTATINEIAQNAEKARNITLDAVREAHSSSDQVTELGTAAQEIEKVVETITEISEQVNLLALNATIEAARAGDAGKGFAVVANEIKELALQTARASGEIKTRVEGIQNSTQGTVTRIRTITDVVNQVNDIVTTIATAIEEQSATTREIADNVSRASRGIDEVNRNVGESSRVASEIAEEIAKVTREAKEMSSSSELVSMNAGELAGLSDQLDKLVKRFKI